MASHWEKSEIEKVDTQFLKGILGCAIHTSDIMTTNELGRGPLICDVIRKSALINQALEYEHEKIYVFNIFQLVRKFTPYFQECEEFVEPFEQEEGPKTE